MLDLKYFNGFYYLKPNNNNISIKNNPTFVGQYIVFAGSEYKVFRYDFNKTFDEKSLLSLGNARASGGVVGWRDYLYYKGYTTGKLFRISLFANENDINEELTTFPINSPPCIYGNYYGAEYTTYAYVQRTDGNSAMKNHIYRINVDNKQETYKYMNCFTNNPPSVYYNTIEKADYLLFSDLDGIVQTIAVDDYNGKPTAFSPQVKTKNTPRMYNGVLFYIDVECNLIAVTPGSSGTSVLIARDCQSMPAVIGGAVCKQSGQGSQRRESYSPTLNFFFQGLNNYLYKATVVGLNTDTVNTPKSGEVNTLKVEVNKTKVGGEETLTSPAVSSYAVAYNSSGNMYGSPNDVSADPTFLLDVWGEGRVYLIDKVAGFDDANNLNQYTVVSGGGAKIPNLFEVPGENNVPLEPVIFPFKDNQFKYVTCMNSPISFSTAEEMVRVFNKYGGGYIVVWVEMKYYHQIRSSALLAGLDELRNIPTLPPPLNEINSFEEIHIFYNSRYGLRHLG
jgi:hypothetical protein